MIGNNKIVLNSACVAEALTDYLNKHLLIAKYVKVSEWDLEGDGIEVVFAPAPCEVAAGA